MRIAARRLQFNNCYRRILEAPERWYDVDDCLAAIDLVELVDASASQ